ncbi:hypothetical protein [Rickettsiella massiliensis]|uniref:hypothetical protein n=1 Tax=Rickettsiella massiliensis TaxID=676517 RepID=UPI0012EA4545|nr:hypothetical protein [Rickettsiella massiliensis]
MPPPPSDSCTDFIEQIKSFKFKPKPPVVGQQPPIPPPSGKSNSDKNPMEMMADTMKVRRFTMDGDDHDDDNSKDWDDEEDHSYSTSPSC